MEYRRRQLFGNVRRTIILVILLIANLLVYSWAMVQVGIGYEMGRARVNCDNYKAFPMRLPEPVHSRVVHNRTA